MVSFTYPIIGEAIHTVTLPDPEVGNADTFEPTMSVYRSRNNTPYTVITHTRADAVVEDSTYTFDNVRPEVVKAFRAFLLNTAGQYLKYIDHVGDEWVVLLIDSKVQFSTVGRGEFSTFSLPIRKWSAS